MLGFLYPAANALVAARPCPSAMQILFPMKVLEPADAGSVLASNLLQHQFLGLLPRL